MRWALVAGGALLTLAACGTASGGTTATPAVPGGGQPPAVASQTKAGCEAVGQAYTKSMGPLAEAVTKMVNGGGGTAAQAQAKLKDFSAAIRTATEQSGDAELRADGKQTADALQAKSADAKTFSAIKTQDDVSKLLGPTLKGWLSPVTQHCS